MRFLVFPAVIQTHTRASDPPSVIMVDQRCLRTDEVAKLLELMPRCPGFKKSLLLKKKAKKFLLSPKPDPHLRHRAGNGRGGSCMVCKC